MKKTYFLPILSVLLLALPGCAKTEQVTSRPVLSLEEDTGLKVAMVDDAKVENSSISRNMVDLAVQSEPLVVRKNTYNSYGFICDSDEYEYDEYNRVKKRSRYHYNNDMRKLELTETDDYSYDDYFIYVDTTHENKNGEVTSEVFDLHGNPIVMTIEPEEGSENEEYSTEVFTFRYPTDTERAQEEYCYEGEEMKFMHHALKRFNDRGDEIFSMTERRNMVKTWKTSPVYDDEGKIIHKDIVHEVEGIADASKKHGTVDYTYDEEGRITSMHEVYIWEDVWEEQFNSDKLIEYGYDLEGRLSVEKTTEDGEITSVVYEY